MITVKMLESDVKVGDNLDNRSLTNSDIINILTHFSSNV